MPPGFPWRGFTATSRVPESSDKSPGPWPLGPATKKRRPMGRRSHFKSCAWSLEVFRPHLISMPLFGQIHLATLPSLIRAFAWMVFTPKIVSAL